MNGASRETDGAAVQQKSVAVGGPTQQGRSSAPE